jgi:hypothetical protein
MVGWVALAAFIGTIPLANAWLNHFGFWDVPGLGPVASGVIWVGFAFVLRDLAQLILGRRYAWAGIVVGAVLSWWLATPALAIASGAAFACSETMDALVYTPLANRRFVAAVLAAGCAGSLVDSAVFVRLAFHSFTGWWQLGVVKALIVLLATPVAYEVRQRVWRPALVAT